MKILLSAFLMFTSIYGCGQTPNLGLSLPSVGSPDWGTVLNNNFTIIDTKVATFPSATPGIVYNTSLTKSRATTYADIISLWSGCSSGFLQFNGTCAAGGGLSSFTVTSLSPLFTATLGANPTTAPALAFTLSTAPANSIFGNFTGSTATPTYSATPVFSAASLTSFPTFNQNTTGSAASLSANLPIANLNSGTGASSSTYWRGDGVWATPSGAGTVTTTGTPASGNMTKFSGSTSITNATAGTDYQAPITLTTTGSSGAATFISNVLNIPQYTGGGGGTVTAVSVATANGVSGTSSGGATPALTIALGAITPTSVASTGTAFPIQSATSSNTDLVGEITLSGGTGTYTFVSSPALTNRPECFIHDHTTPANDHTNTFVVTASTLTVTSTGTTDVIGYGCIGRN